jgi:hypothetical protein
MLPGTSSITDRHAPLSRSPPRASTLESIGNDRSRHGGRGDQGPDAGAWPMRRRQQSSETSRCRTSRRNPRGRVLARRRARILVYRAPGTALALLVGVVAGLAIAAVATGYALAGTVTIGVVILAWLALALRVSIPEPAGPRGDGPAPPGGAAVREPRRPLPFAPAGAAAMQLPEEEPPRRSVALA